MMRPNFSSILVKLLLLITGFVTLCCISATTYAVEGDFVVTPAEVQLRGNLSRAQLIATAVDQAGKVIDRALDLTISVKYTSSNPQVVSVNETGGLLAAGNGTANITLTYGQHKKLVKVTVAEVSEHPAIGFNEQIIPILAKGGCSMGACHASQYGKGGFKISVMGFDPDLDYNAIVRDRQQRRINSLNPELSLFLRKPAMEVPHGGSRRIKKGSVDYQLMVAWIKGGALGPDAKAPKVTKITVTPNRRITTTKQKQQLRVVAEYSDSTTRDVTAWARFDTMDDTVVAVSSAGLVTTLGKGQAPVMVRFEGQAEIAMFVNPYADSVDLAGWKNNNFVDELASAKFKELGIVPSELCDDATFVRRVFLDAIGTVPTPEITEQFIKSTDPKKREKLIDQLLGLTGDPNQDIYDDLYAAFWTLKWSDLMKNTSKKVGEQGLWSLHNWIRESFRVNKPFDQFVTELVTAKGSIYSNGPANYFRINANQFDLTESTAQLFMGVRLMCAKCHHHPFEKYSQSDYYGFAAFFSRVATKNSEEFGYFGRETIVMIRSTGESTHPKTRKVMKPTPLEGEPVDHELDRRIPLAEWLTSPENSFFSKSIVNRYVDFFLGRALVEPVDDMRATNPPSNVALLEALSKDFVDKKFDLKQLIRNIMVSRLYQLSSTLTKENASDNRFYSHYKVKRIAAEPLLDAIDQVTGSQTKFKSLPPGTRAIELPDAEYPNYFLTTFAKPKRVSACECERVREENLVQALHTLNGDTIQNKLADKNGRIAKLLLEKISPEETVRKIYMAVLCRYPSAEEIAACQKLLAESPTPKEFYEDLCWALLNSKQFLFNH